MNNKGQGNSSNWITITRKRKKKNEPSEIRIDRNGNVFIDGQLYDEKQTQYANLSVSVERYNKFNSGEDTLKMIEKQKETEKGSMAVITDIEEPNKTEKTTVKY